MRTAPRLMVAMVTMVITCAAAGTARACTTFLAWHAGEPVVGKSYDWNQQVGLVTVNPRGLEKKALVINPMDTPATWVSRYGSLTFNQYGIEFPNGGLNEQGLAIEIMWLNSSQYPAADNRPVTNELQWIQRGLDLFATVDELARDAPSIRVSPIYGRVHYLACDAQAECAAFEYLDGELLVTRGAKMPAKTLTNDTYPESARTLSSFDGFGGTDEMPESSSSIARFVRASMLARTTEGTTIPDSAFAILKSVETPFTVWSIVYGLRDGMVHFRTWSSPKVKLVHLPGFSLACGTRKVLDIDTDATGDVGARFVDYSKAAHRDLLAISMTEMAAEVGQGVLDMFINYPDSVHCSPAAQGSPDAGAAAPDSDRQASDGCSCSVARATHPHPSLGAFLLLIACAVRLIRRGSGDGRGECARHVYSRDNAQWITILLAGGLAACQGGSPHRKRDAGSRPVSAYDASLARDATEAGSNDAAAGAADTWADAVHIPTTIVRTSIEPWGANCGRGGVKVETVLDLNGNHTIDSSDQTLSQEYVCNVYAVSTTVGPHHSCALASNGTVWCWGADEVGQLGDLGEHAAYAPRPVAGVETARALAAGGDFSCVILPTTGVRCWGKSDRGQCGHGGEVPFLSPSCVNMPDGPLLGANSLALGGAHACAVIDGGKIECWGANDAGQLGDGKSVDRGWPEPVLGISNAQSVAAGGRHTCAVLADSTVRCWGASDEGQLGDGAIAAHAAAVAVRNADGTGTLSGVAAIAAGDAFTCALMQDATAWCWGSNAECQLGLPGSTLRALVPVAAPVRDVRSLAAGSQHVCAVLASGKAACWGRNDVGQVGAPAGACHADPVRLPLAHVLSVGAGRTHSCAVDEIGVWCWGDNSQGQLGIGIASAARSTHEPQLAIWHLAP